MAYENDYIMRTIREMLRVIAKLLGKTTVTYELPSEENDTEEDALYRRLIGMADAGEINEAENMLFEALEENGEAVGGAALAFYEHLNDMDADFLDEHDYSREEVSLGIKNVARVLGCESVANALM